MSVAALAGLAGVLPPLEGAAAAEPAGEAVVIRFASGADEQERAEVLEASDLVVVDRLPGSDFALVAAADGGVVEAAGAVASPAVEDVAPLGTVRAFAIPDDPGYPLQWHLHLLDVASAWDTTTGVGATVAVIDTGVASETRDGFVRAPDLARTRFVPGWDFVDDDAHPDDEHGHGTHVAGTIAQSTGNGLGVAGVAPGASLMPLRALGADGLGTDFAVAKAIAYAVDNGADVINLSLGQPERSTVMAAAVADAVARGVTVVAASGNDGAATVSYPAAEPEAISVGAVRPDRSRATYANHGPELDLVGPGGEVSLDLDRDGRPDGVLQQTIQPGSATGFCYCYVSGTSMAAPHVSGVAALLVARGVTDPHDIRSMLTGTATDLGVPGRDDEFGDGLVQAGRAVAAPLPEGVTGAATVAPRGIAYACPDGAVPPPPFTDISATPHGPAIACVAWWKVAGGVTETLFVPGGAVTRGQLASFVARALEQAGLALPEAPPDAFDDDDGSTHEVRIDQLAALGVVGGRSPRTYDPHAGVSRAAMASVLVRAHDLVADAPLVEGRDRFGDDQGSTHEPNINKAAGAGLAAGTAPLAFSPHADVTRAQMATFLARTLDLFVASGTTPPR